MWNKLFPPFKSITPSGHVVRILLCRLPPPLSGCLGWVFQAGPDDGRARFLHTCSTSDATISRAVKGRSHLLLLFSLLSSCSLRMLRFCWFTSSSSLILPQRLPEHLYWTCSPQFALSVPPHLEPPGPLPLPCSPDYWSPCLLLGFRSACWFTTRYHWSECSWLFLTLFVTIENIKCTLKKQG